MDVVPSSAVLDRLVVLGDEHMILQGLPLSLLLLLLRRQCKAESPAGARRLLLLLPKEPSSALHVLAL